MHFIALLPEKYNNELTCSCKGEVYASFFFLTALSLRKRFKILENYELKAFENSLVCSRFVLHFFFPVYVFLYSTDQLIVKLLLSFCYLFTIFLTAFAFHDRNLFVFKRDRNLKLANFRNLTEDI